MRLKGKCVLITGAGSGIGRALAVEAARRGMTVALCGRRADALAETAALLGAGAAHIVIQADVTGPDDRRMLVNRIRERWGKLDVLINNAGIVPVSYTHLCDKTKSITSIDGWKERPPHKRPSPAVLSRLSQDKSSGMDSKMSFGEAHGTQAVSYTHLDVYKRQANCKLPGITALYLVAGGKHEGYGDENWKERSSADVFLAPEMIVKAFSGAKPATRKTKTSLKVPPSATVSLE